ncbi:archease [Pseudomonas zhanjiangensis]|uniref:Archease n=1 Tax=Pseudomonas zhanjiangensis TaxID=3239015 RepID=A0ABV3YQ59_9PSED
MAQPCWQHLEHGADIGVRGCADSLPEAFAQAALALTALITEPAAIVEREAVRIDCREADPELLLYDWLNALVYAMATRGLLFGRFQVSIEADHLQATAYGEAVDRQRHRPAVEVKGATMTGLQVRPATPGGWIVECIVDV